MARRKEPKPPTAPLVQKRRNEFDGLTTDARADLAVGRIRGQWGHATQAILSIGQTLVDACHDGDEQAALADVDDKNEVFVRISRSLGTLEGGPGSDVLSVARRIAAVSDASRSSYWKVLPYSHKAAMVVLTDVDRIEVGAEAAVKFSWTVLQVKRWVDQERAAAGIVKKKRGIRLVTAVGSAAKLVEAGKPTSLDRLGEEFSRLDAKRRAELRAELEEAAASLTAIRRRLAEVDRSRPPKGKG